MQKIPLDSMPVPCARWAEKLAAAHKDDLLPEERVALERHVASCVHCTAVRAEYREMDTLLAPEMIIEPLAELPAQLQALIAEQEAAEQQGTFADHTLPKPLPLRGRTVLTSPTTVRAKRLMRVASALAAVLVLGAILGSALLLFRSPQSNLGSVGPIPANWHCPISRIMLPPSGEGASTQTVGVVSQSILYTVDNNWTAIKATRLNDGSTVRTYQAINHTNFSPQITVSGGVIYGIVYGNSSQQSSIQALRASDGATLWQKPFPDLYGKIIIENGVVYADTIRRHDLYALDAATGRLLKQSRKMDLNDFLLTVSQGIAYVQHGYSLYALDPLTSQVLWQFNANDLEHTPNFAIADGRVYVQASDSNIYILQADTGHLIRKIVQPLSQNFDPRHAPLVAGNTIYVNTAEDYLYALQATDGSALWCIKVGKSAYEDALAVANGIVYLSIGGGRIEAFDTKTGKLLWRFQTEGSGFTLAPIISNGVVCAIADDNTVYALRPNDGTLLWKTQA